MYEPARELPEKKATEGDFYKSLSYLKKHYGLDLCTYRNLPYPYNILMAEREVNKKLKSKTRYRELLILKQEDNQISLTVKETFKREFGLYYVPVMPIYEMWQKPEQQACAELLTAVCAYLHIEAGISYYREEDTYMYYNYEILNDWIEDDQGDMEEGDYERQKHALDKAKKYGDFILEKMMANGFRQSLDSLIANFQAVTEFEKTSLEIAVNTWKLWQTNPETHLYKHGNNPCNGEEMNEDDYYNDDNFVGLNEYIGFIGSTNDVMSDTLFNIVNNDFNERPAFQEPQINTFFNEPMPAYTDQLAYEDKLLELITDLCTLLYNQP